MTRYILGRVALAILTIFVLATLIFFLIRLLPGDPFMDPKIPAEIQQRQRAYYGLDKPVFEQYLIYLQNLLKGDLGVSLRYTGRTVNSMIAESFRYSADLGMRALVFSTIFGIGLGILAALKKDRIWDHAAIIIAVIGVAIPSFVVGTVLQYFFSVKLRILPVAQYKSFAHTILPTFALGLGTLATLARLMRTSMLDVISMDYIKAARAKGLTETQVTVKHQIRNAMLPVVTVVGISIATLLCGTFVIENIYAIPGLGRYYVMGIQNLDYPLISGLTIVFGTFLVAAQLLVDVLYGIVDPRIRVAGSKR